MSTTSLPTQDRKALLEILQQSIFNYQKVDPAVEVKEVVLDGVATVVILLPQTILKDNNLEKVPQKEGAT